MGLAAAASSQILDAAVVITGHVNKELADHVRAVGCELVELAKNARLGDLIAVITGSNEVDSAIDAVGFERACRGEQPAIVLNQMMEITRAVVDGGILGLDVTEDRCRRSGRRKERALRLHLGWASAQSFHTRQTPVLKYNRAP